MANRTHGAIAPTLTVIDGIPTTTSTDIACHFGKRHDLVLRDVRNILAQLPTDRALNFVETFTEVPGPNGAVRRSPAYRITRDGFTLLAMGFTGTKALGFKLAYIDAFNKLQAALTGQAQSSTTPAPVPCLDDLHLLQVEGVINHLRARHDLSAKTLRDAIRSRFGVRTFADIPRTHYEAVINVLREFAPAPQPQSTQVVVPSPSGDALVTITFTPKGNS